MQAAILPEPGTFDDATTNGFMERFVKLYCRAKKVRFDTLTRDVITHYQKGRRNNDQFLDSAHRSFSPNASHRSSFAGVKFDIPKPYGIEYHQTSFNSKHRSHTSRSRH